MGMPKEKRESARVSRALLRPPGLRMADMFVVGCMIALSFLFSQIPLNTDLEITSSFSYAYLEGHFIDFNSYNMAVFAGSNKYISYLQPLYLIIAAWCIPLKLFGLTAHAAQGVFTLGDAERAWIKLLLALFFLLCALIVQKIARLIAPDRQSSKLCVFLFVSSPLAIYTIFLFNGYDIFSLTFILLGLYAFLRHKRWQFLLWFALAIPFKFFALLPFVPLLLLDEKNFWKILRGLVIAAAPTLACYYVSSLDPGGNTLWLLEWADKHAITLNLGTTMMPLIFLLAYLSICLFAYFKNAGDGRERQKYAIFLPLAAFSIIFIVLFWHPQWVILLTPFLALAFPFSPNRKLTLLSETLSTAALFAGIVYTYFFGMAHNPRAEFPPHPYIDTVLLPCLLAPFIIQYIYRKQEECPAPALTKNEVGWLRLRCYGGLAAMVAHLLIFGALVLR